MLFAIVVTRKLRYTTIPKHCQIATFGPSLMTVCIPVIILRTCDPTHLLVSPLRLSLQCGTCGCVIIVLLLCIYATGTYSVTTTPHRHKRAVATRSNSTYIPQTNKQTDKRMYTPRGAKKVVAGPNDISRILLLNRNI